MPRSRPPAPPRGPQGPQGPDSPNAPRKRSSRFGKRSKTKNIKCSEAASAWQIAIRSGGSPGAEVYKTLAHCRAANKTAKAGLAAGTAAGAALANRAVTSRVDRSLATATSRKAELQTRIRERAGRTISDADRQRANDIASRVSGNSNGPSAGLRRLQGVRATRTRRTTTQAATPPPAATPAPARAPRTRRAPRAIPDAGQTNRLPDPVRQKMGLQPPLRTESGIRSEAAALFRNMRATGRGQQARDLSGMARMKIVARDGLSRNLNNSLRRASPLEILNQASRQGVAKQPIIQGPKAPRIGLEAYRASRALRTQPGVAESRSAAARGLVALRQAGTAGRGDAQAVRRLTSSSSTGRRGDNVGSAIVQMRVDAGRRFHARGNRANDKAYSLGMGISRDLTTAPAIRSAAARELAEVRRTRNASFAVSGDRGPREHWRAAAGATQIANQNMQRAHLPGTTASHHVALSGVNRTEVSNRFRQRLSDGQRDAAAQAAAARRAAAAPPPPAANPRVRTNAAGQDVFDAPQGGYSSRLASSARQNSETHSPTPPRAANHHENAKAAHVNQNVAVPTRRAVAKTPFTAAQLSQARQQAGPIGNYAATSRHSAAERAKFVADAEVTGVKLVGSTSDEKFNHLVALSGVHPANGDRVSLQAGYEANSIQINIPGGYRTLKVETNSAGKKVPMIYNNLYDPNGRSAANGQAIDQYSRSALAARAAGVSHISVSGGGRGNGVDGTQSGMTGYFAWPSYGFDGRMDGRAAARVRGAHPDLENATNFSEAFFHPNPTARAEARAAWAIHHDGAMPRVTLDLTDTNSVSYQNFSGHFAHTQRRAGRTLATHNLSTIITRNGGYEN